jgi:MFS family permease
MDGPPQIALLMALLAIGLGCTIGVVPAIAGDRFARLHHGYDGVADCSSFDSETKPEACFLGGSDAQAAASLANLINNSLTFLTASLAGSISDEYGRKGKNQASELLRGLGEPMSWIESVVVEPGLLQSSIQSLFFVLSNNAGSSCGYAILLLSF